VKLVRFGDPGQERPGLIDAAGRLRDISGVVSDITGATLLPESLARLRALKVDEMPIVGAGARFGPPLRGVGKIVGVGLNYRDHAAEAGKPVPAEPVVFLKSLAALSGPNDSILLPRWSEKTDWEVELVVVIGAPTRHVAEDDVADHIAGYCLGLDVSERSWQLPGGCRLAPGKSFVSFAPIGPWIATADELSPSPGELTMQLAVNGETFQNGTTADMIVKIAQLISHISGALTLSPGDLVFTGTPAGTGMGQKPPRYLRSGDLLTAALAGLGAQHHVVARL
jgi:2-keto-4-pentenoate hydratase/2-oxohepta-3-ene-1,7-dioic acid hydratase in catechol pathway